jgi:hypothetical protein
MGKQPLAAQEGCIVYISVKLKFVTVVLRTSFGYFRKEWTKGTITHRDIGFSDFVHRPDFS